MLRLPGLAALLALAALIAPSASGIGLVAVETRPACGLTIVIARLVDAAQGPVLVSSEAGLFPAPLERAGSLGAPLPSGAWGEVSVEPRYESGWEGVARIALGVRESSLSVPPTVVIAQDRDGVESGFAFSLGEIPLDRSAPSESCGAGASASYSGPLGAHLQPPSEATIAPEPFSDELIETRLDEPAEARATPLPEAFSVLAVLVASSRRWLYK